MSKKRPKKGRDLPPAKRKSNEDMEIETELADVDMQLVPSGPSQEKYGFEILYKPLPDSYIKNWKISLSLYLKEYGQYLDRNVYINFTLATLIIQNSGSFFCKRVDLLHRMVLELLSRLNKHIAGHEPPAIEGPKKEKRKKNLEANDFEPLDFVYSDTNIDVNLDKITKQDKNKRKQIVLNSSVKVKSKPIFSCPIYQSDGTPMGSKDEFRLQWRVFSDGTLNEDFSYNESSTTQYGNLDTSEIDLGKSSNNSECGDDFVGMDSYTADMDIDPRVPTPIPTDPIEPQDTECFTRDDNILSSTPVSFPNEIEAQVNVPQRRKKANKKLDWDTIDYNSKVSKQKFKAKNPFKIPKLLTDTTKKRKNEDEVEFEVSLYNGTVSVSSLAIEFKKDIVKKKRKEIIFKRRMGIGIPQVSTVNQPTAVVENEENDEWFDNRDDDVFNDDADDGNDAEVDAGPQDMQSHVPDVLPAKDRDNEAERQVALRYEKETAHKLEVYQEQRKINERKHEELNKQVAEWQESIQEELRIAELRKDFCVQRYSSEILSHFDGIDSVVPFHNIVKGKPTEEVSRYFLCTLMLTNTYNLEPRTTKEGDCKMDCLEYKLLSTVRHQEEMDEQLRVTTTTSIIPDR